MWFFPFILYFTNSVFTNWPGTGFFYFFTPPLKGERRRIHLFPLEIQGKNKWIFWKCQSRPKRHQNKISKQSLRVFRVFSLFTIKNSFFLIVILNFSNLYPSKQQNKTQRNNKLHMYIQPEKKTTTKTAIAAFYPQEIKKKATCPSIYTGRARTGKQTGGPG